MLPFTVPKEYYEAYGFDGYYLLIGFSMILLQIAWLYKFRCSPGYLCMGLAIVDSNGNDIGILKVILRSFAYVVFSIMAILINYPYPDPFYAVPFTLALLGSRALIVGSAVVLLVTSEYSFIDMYSGIKVIEKYKIRLAFWKNQ